MPIYVACFPDGQLRNYLSLCPSEVVSIAKQAGAYAVYKLNGVRVWEDRSRWPRQESYECMEAALIVE